MTMMLLVIRIFFIFPSLTGYVAQRTSAQSQETADGLPSRLPAEVGVAYGTHPAVMRPRPILTPTDAPYVRSMRTDYQDSYLPHSITGNVGQRLPPPGMYDISGDAN